VDELIRSASVQAAESGATLLFNLHEDDLWRHNYHLGRITEAMDAIHYYLGVQVVLSTGADDKRSDWSYREASVQQ